MKTQQGKSSRVLQIKHLSSAVVIKERGIVLLCSCRAMVQAIALVWGCRG